MVSDVSDNLQNDDEMMTMRSNVKSVLHAPQFEKMVVDVDEPKKIKDIRILITNSKNNLILRNAIINFNFLKKHNKKKEIINYLIS